MKLMFRCQIHVLQLDLATTKARQSLKQLAKKNDVKSARLLAKEVVRTNKQKNRLTMSKARLGSIQMQMQHQACEYYSVVLSIGNGEVDRRAHSNSYGQGDRGFPKVDRDNESQQPVGPAATVECNDEGNADGDDEGEPWLISVSVRRETDLEPPIPVRNHRRDDGRYDGSAR
jgi:hypothetical protein